MYSVYRHNEYLIEKHKCEKSRNFLKIYLNNFPRSQCHGNQEWGTNISINMKISLSKSLSVTDPYPFKNVGFTIIVHIKEFTKTSTKYIYLNYYLQNLKLYLYHQVLFTD